MAVSPVYAVHVGVPLEAERNVGSPGAGVIGGSKPLDVGAEAQSQVLEESSCS